ncbi:MAG: hypothetical protein EPO11_00250 [Gammaproteobacteria bacterium]|nr:MAG: hypothetical protein EPO11_00250 [Gammaproteobacteria bacterium]
MNEIRVEINTFPFSHLTVDIQRLILAKALSKEMPEFFRDLGRLARVCKEFKRLDEEFSSWYMRYMSRAEVDFFHHNLSDYYANIPIEHDAFGRISLIRNKIGEVKGKLSQSIFKRNSWAENSKIGCCIRSVVIVISILAIDFLTLLFRLDQCESIQDSEELNDCVFMLPFWEKIIPLDDEATSFLLITVFQALLTVSVYFEVASAERFFHLLTDLIQLALLNYMESSHIKELAQTHDQLYEFCKRVVVVTKWEEKLATHHGEEVLQQVISFKQSERFQLIQAIAKLGDKHRVSNQRNTLFTRLPQHVIAIQPVEEETPLLLHNNR